MKPGMGFQFQFGTCVTVHTTAIIEKDGCVNFFFDVLVFYDQRKPELLTVVPSNSVE